jgi:hypothetical protein
MCSLLKPHAYGGVQNVNDATVQYGNSGTAYDRNSMVRDTLGGCQRAQGKYSNVYPLDTVARITIQIHVRGFWGWNPQETPACLTQ